MNKKSLVGQNLSELQNIVAELGGSKFRATQIYNGIYLKSYKSFDDMTDLPLAFRTELNEKYVMSDVVLKDKQVSADGTMKFLFELADGNVTEAVLMRFDNRANLTACISSQVGCPMGCAFCATAKLGFKRNLKTDEILKQIYLIQADTSLKVTNIVFMGQGEPLLNLDNVLPAIERLRDDFKIGSRRITVSTFGIIPGINRLADLSLQSTLAISLHAPTHDLRKEIMPIENRYPLPELKKALLNYVEKTGRRITIEYILIHKFNDTQPIAKELAHFLKDLKCNVNLIPYNSVIENDYKKPSNTRIDKFYKVLFDAGFTVIKRTTRGDEISAACGQLAGQVKDKLARKKIEAKVNQG